MVIPAFAQSADNRTNYDLQVNTTSGEPVLEQLSDKGLYRVELRWPVQVQNPEGGIEVEIVFLNASALASSKQDTTTTGTESNETGINSDAIDTGDAALEPTLPVESYDITIFGGDGKELWKKVEQPGVGGRGAQSFQFMDNYTGPITIEINNIKPGWDISTNATESEMIDSVKFMATVVPEFPFFALPLAAAVVLAAAIASLRLSLKRIT
jgi:hypothetical protein